VNGQQDLRDAGLGHPSKNVSRRQAAKPVRQALAARPWNGIAPAL